MVRKVKSIIWNMIDRGCNLEAISKFPEEYQNYFNKHKKIIEQAIKEKVEIKNMVNNYYAQKTRAQLPES